MPTFDGDIMNRKIFWEQYEVSIHSSTQLTDAEKLAHLRHLLKDGPAQHIIEGLKAPEVNRKRQLSALRSTTTSHVYHT